MEWTFRTLVRVFLLVGGLVFAAFGVVNGSATDAALGAVAAALGAFRLWWERRDGGE